MPTKVTVILGFGLMSLFIACVGTTARAQTSCPDSSGPNSSGIVTRTVCQIVLGGLNDEYAPATIDGNQEGILWTGGWLNQQERDSGFDRIHVATKNPDGTYSWPQVALFRDGWQLNDPSVIQHPILDWQFMYYTANPSGNPANVNIGFARSMDGGFTWGNEALILGPDPTAYYSYGSCPNNPNANGIGTPSAVRMPPAQTPSGEYEVWVWAMDWCNPAINVRIRLNINGWQILDTATVTFNNDPEVGDVHMNPDVTYRSSNGTYYMVLNRGKDSALSNISLYTSPDGLKFMYVQDLVNSGSVCGTTSGTCVVTPRIHLREDDSGVDLFFGYSTSGLLQFQSIPKWSYNFSTGGGRVALSVSPTEVPAGGSVKVSWSGINSPTSRDWIGMYTPGSDDGSYLSWKYTSGASSGSVSFDIPLSAATGTYEMRLFANNGFTRLATSNAFRVSGSSSLPPPPAAPSDLVAQAGNNRDIYLAWIDNSTNETGFQLYRQPDGGSWSLIATLEANRTTYSDLGLVGSTTYFYSVYAFNSGGVSGSSNVASATTSPSSPPAAPSDLVAQAGNNRDIYLAWTDNSTNETGFQLYRQPDGGSWSLIATLEANRTTYSDLGLVGSTTYFYSVYAFNSGGVSGSSNVASATTSP